MHLVLWGKSPFRYKRLFRYSGVRVIASRILHEISLLIGELAIRGTKLTLNARLGTENNLLIEQLLLSEHYCISNLVITGVYCIISQLL